MPTTTLVTLRQLKFCRTHAPGLCGHFGCKRPKSDETIEKLKNALTGHPKSLEHRQAISKARIGMKFSDNHRTNISRTKMGRPTGRILSVDERRHIAEKRAHWIAKRGFPWPPTNLEYALQMLLEDAGYEYEAQKKIGSNIVDFYVLNYNLVFEADGSFWHQDKEREFKRDTHLLKQGVTAVIHLDEHDLSSWEVGK